MQVNVNSYCGGGDLGASVVGVWFWLLSLDGRPEDGFVEGGGVVGILEGLGMVCFCRMEVRNGVCELDMLDGIFGLERS
jgi:hypothetical protein